ncbi:hypothetical protein N7513_010991 [Penicillium frequentans]|nr:hypothetical protein N7513_010991 [Penicillium glabrum]
MPVPSHYEIYLAICHDHPDRPGLPPHWMVVLRPPGSATCIRFHTMNGDPVYTLGIEPDKRFDSDSVKYYQSVGGIQASDYTKVVAQAMAIPLQSCQRWARYLLMRLELLGVVCEGCSDLLEEILTARKADLGVGCVKVFRRGCQCQPCVDMARCLARG